IEGLDSPNVVSSDQVLTGNVLIGHTVLLIDGNGHWEAAGTAEYLADAGFAVEIITPAAVLGANLEGTRHALLYQRLAEKRVEIGAFPRLLSVDDNGARVADVWSGVERHIEVDTVVPVIARRS